jgi:Flp pilus assembly protein TadG
MSFFAGEEGAAMVEFAIAGSVFIVILLAIFEFGFAAWDRSSISADAREGARYAMVRGVTSGRTADSAMVADFVKSRTSLDSIQVVTSWSGAKAAGTMVTVMVRHPVPRRGAFLAEHTDSSSSTMVVLF